MIVRIRLQRGPRVKKTRRKNQHVSLAVATLLSPMRMAACALSIWKLTADLGVAGRFAIAGGLFSHWQVWLGVAAGLHLLAIALNRYGNSEPSDPGPLLVHPERDTRETILNSGF